MSTTTTWSHVKPTLTMVPRWQVLQIHRLSPFSIKNALLQCSKHINSLTSLFIGTPHQNIRPLWTSWTSTCGLMFRALREGEEIEGGSGESELLLLLCIKRRKLGLLLFRSEFSAQQQTMNKNFKAWPRVNWQVGVTQSETLSTNILKHTRKTARVESQLLQSIPFSSSFNFSFLPQTCVTANVTNFDEKSCLSVTDLVMLRCS